MRSPLRFTTLLVALCAALTSPLRAQFPTASIARITAVRPGLVHVPNASPDGRFIAAASDSGILMFDTRSKQWSTIGSAARELVWSPNSRFLAFSNNAGDDGSHIWMLGIDPATGHAAGAARRVSMRTGVHPTWSPDSREIAFVADDSGFGRIVATPFNGGAERMLYNRPGTTGPLQWRADGSLYTVLTRPGVPRYVARLHVATGVVDSISGVGGFRGVSNDGRLTAHAMSNTSIQITSATSGAEVQRFLLPQNVTLTSNPAWLPGTTNRLIGVEQIIPQNIHAVTVADGTVRELTTGTSADQQPAYSPDGKRIAFVTLVGGATRIAIINADGTGKRLIPVGGHVITPLQWSPDGRYLAYDGEPAGLYLVDVAAGTDRRLVNLPGRPSFAWRSDSRAIRHLWSAGPRAAIAPHEIRETTLDGKSRTIYQIPDSLAPARQQLLPVGLSDQFHFVGDTLLVVMTPLAAQLIALPAGRASVVPWPSGTKRGRGFDVTRDGQWIAFSLWDSTGKHERLRLLSTRTREIREVPFARGGEMGSVAFLPDGRNLIVSACVTCAQGKEHWDMYVVPVNGDAARALTGKDPHYLDANVYSISPDGRTVVYDAETQYSTAIVAITLPVAPPKR